MRLHYRIVDEDIYSRNASKYRYLISKKKKGRAHQQQHLIGSIFAIYDKFGSVVETALLTMKTS